jgi:hypothetical protein
VPAAAEDADLARTQFGKKLSGEMRLTEYNLTLVRPDGSRFPRASRRFHFGKTARSSGPSVSPFPPVR